MKQIVQSQGKTPIQVFGVEQDRECFGFVCQCGFTSTQWPSKKLAAARAKAHNHEHETGELMPTTRRFLADNGHPGWNIAQPEAAVETLQEKAARLLT